MKIGILCSAQGLEQKRTKTQSIGQVFVSEPLTNRRPTFVLKAKAAPPHPDRYERRFVPPRTFFQNKIGGRRFYVRSKDRTIRHAVDLCIGKSPMPQPGRGLRIEHHRPENESKRPLNETPTFALSPWHLLIFCKESLCNCFLVKRDILVNFYLDRVLRELARILMTKIAK